MRLNRPPWAQVQWIFACRECSIVYKTPTLTIDTTIPFCPQLPDGWTALNHEFICPAHEIVVMSRQEAQLLHE